MSPLETYLRELAAICASGQAVEETSYYAPLANLLNEIGKTREAKKSSPVVRMRLTKPQPAQGSRA